MADEIWKHDDSTLIRKVPPLHKLVNEKKPDLFGAMNLDAQFLETLIKHEVINQVTKERIKDAGSNDGMSEVLFDEIKSVGQLRRLHLALAENNQDILMTKLGFNSDKFMERSRQRDINLGVFKRLMEGIKREAANLAREIEYDALKPYMEYWNILDRIQRQHINEHRPNERKVELLCNYLLKRPVVEAVLFAKALIKSDQIHCLRIILPDEKDVQAIVDLDLDYCLRIKKEDPNAFG